MIGETYNKLTIIENLGIVGGHTKVLCRCECGKTKQVRYGSLTSGNTKSCGCGYLKRHVAHDLCHHPLYGVWRQMKQRCYNPNNNRFNTYGARGITVCDEWKSNFKAFYDWAISYGYESGLEIDRKNVDGNYEPTNCRFVTSLVNANNKTSNILIEFGSTKASLAEWSKTTGINYGTLKDRLIVNKWPIEKALTTPVRTMKHA